MPEKVKSVLDDTIDLVENLTFTISSKFMAKKLDKRKNIDLSEVLNMMELLTASLKYISKSMIKRELK